MLTGVVAAVLTDGFAPGHLKLKAGAVALFAPAPARYTYGTAVDLSPGLAAMIDHVVSEADTSSAMGTSDVPVLSTPRIILLAEQATGAALAGRLEPGLSAVEHRVEISHVAPSAVGAAVRAEAVLESIDGRRLVFRVTISDQRGLVAAGRFTRVIVSRDRFLEKTESGI